MYSRCCGQPPSSWEALCESLYGFRSSIRTSTTLGCKSPSSRATSCGLQALVPQLQLWHPHRMVFVQSVGYTHSQLTSLMKTLLQSSKLNRMGVTLPGKRNVYSFCAVPIQLLVTRVKCIAPYSSYVYSITIHHNGVLLCTQRLQNTEQNAFSSW